MSTSSFKTTINGIEAIEEVVAGTQLEATQLTPGAITGEMVHLSAGNALISAAEINGSFRAYGPLSESNCTIGALLEVRGANSQWAYQTMSGDIAVVPGGVEHDARYGDSTNWVTISLPPNDLCELVRLYELDLSDAFWCRPAMYRPSVRTRRYIVSQLKRALSAVDENPAALSSPYASQALRDDMVEALLQGYVEVNDVEIDKGRRSVRSYQLATLAEEYLRAHADRPVRLKELCESLAVSERTLRRAFLEKYGIPPASYLQRWRLSQVRRELLNSPAPDQTVSRAAMKFGFWDLSRFATQYFSLFRERPSTTLARGRTSDEYG